MPKIEPKDFTSVINSLLDEYGDDVLDAVVESADASAKKAAKSLKTAGKFKNRSGKYRRGWRTTNNKSRLTYSSTVYNKDAFQLAHLLEFGHALKLGGRAAGKVQAFPHIEEVNDQAQSDFENYLEEKLKT